MRADLAVSLCATVMLAACAGGGSGSPASPSETAGPLSFTVAPVDPASLDYIVPLGNMGPWAHTLPTDHVYFYRFQPPGNLAVLAPAAGTIDNIYPGVNGEVKVWVRVNGQFTYYFDHVVLASGLATGTHVDAGTVIGTAPGIAFDFAVRDMASPLAFIAPTRYGMDTLYGQSPLKYFAEPLRSQFYAKVARSGGDLDGRVNYDVDGSVSGNWFADDLPVTSSSSNDVNVGTRQLAFARDVRFPERLRVSVGGFGFTGLYGVPPDAPEFSGVTPASGFVVFRLLETGEPGGPPGVNQRGLLLVQMLDARRLRVEVVQDSLARQAEFSDAAKIYVR